MQQQIPTHTRRAARHYRRLHKNWLEPSLQELRSLQQD